MKNKFTRLKRDSSTAELYEKLLKTEGPFKSLNDISSKDIFLLALTIGYSELMPSPIDSPNSFIKPESFGDVLLPLVHSIAITQSDKGVSILAEEQSDIYSFSEEYANAGIHYLNSRYHGNENKLIEDWRREIIKSFKKDKILERVDKLL